MGTSGREISRLAEGIAEDERQESRRAGAVSKSSGHEAEQRRQRQLGRLIALSVVLVGFTAANLAGLNPLVDRLPLATDEEIELAALAAVEGLVDDLEDWREEWGVLPETLDDLTDSIGIWSYTRWEDGGFQLTLEADGATVTYDTSQGTSTVFARLREYEENS